MCKYSLPYLESGASIVITSSVVGLTSDAGICAYATAKHALVGLMRTLAKETAPRGIRVNTIHPGPVDNEFQHRIEVAATGADRDRAASIFDQFIPLGRHAAPDEVGRAMLFLASVAGQIGSQTDPPYSASKAALINFAQCAARDLAPYGVRVNTLCPGMVQTALNRSVWEAWVRQQPEGQRQSYEEWAGEKVRRVVPLGRWQTPEDVAAMAVFLASPRANNITGQTINVDGGFVMHW